MVSPVIYSFIKGQLKASSISKYGRRWSLEDKNLCLQIYLSSPKSYDTLKAFFNLPSKPTLRKSISGIYLEPGFSSAVLQSLRLVVSKLKCHDKYCILSFDEMTLKRGLSYDKKNDRIVGFENYGSYSKPTVIPQYATHALVFMVRGLCKKWKQVFGFFFASHTTSSDMLCSLVMEALSKLFDCGLTPVAIVCDGGANNMMCYTKAMRVTEERPYIMCQDRKVFTVFDVPHLLKCLRNNFIKYDVKFLNNKVASWEHIKSLWEFDRQMPHRIAPKLSDRHVNVDGLSTMNVKLAAQVFSHSLAAGLCFLSAVGRLPASASHTADFCSNVNKLFDSLNSRKINHN
ncbi:THAP domain-containing protein 9, partial [Stegodyphus mimosarum]